jgi:cyclopropane-fatty-acyl-phospholipid synthase
MRSLLHRMLSSIIKRGNLSITYADGSSAQLGDGTGKPVHIRFNNRKAEWGIFIEPSFYLGHYYGTGDFDLVQGDMYDLLEIVFTGNPDGGFHWTPLVRAMDFVRYLTRWFREKNGLGRARRNVHHHYDISGAVYDLFLDADRQYSCAYFEEPGQSLDDAQLAKKRHIAAKLVPDRSGLSMLDIGCGWGGMALYLARHTGARVTGITLSEEQIAIARDRVQSAGLEKEVRFDLQDYRDTEGSFDRIVSVGMFEHVGRPNYTTFFHKAASLLKRDGVMLLHTIGRTDGPNANNPFIERYIFPGGYIPALSEVLPAIEKSGLGITDIEILRLHYAETLRHWRERFMARREEAKALEGERFCRIWEFYLAASESAFRWQNLVVFQIQLAHDQEAVPLTRNYLPHGEDCLRAHEGNPRGDKRGARQFPQEASL